MSSYFSINKDKLVYINYYTIIIIAIVLINLSNI